PEKQDVVAADEQRRGIKRAQVRRVVGPAQRRERPKARTEPRIQHVAVLFELSATAFRAFLRRAGRQRAAVNDYNSRIARGRDATAGAMPDRNAMAPPELPRDAPITDICQPIGEDLALIIWHDPDLPLLDRFCGSVSQGAHLAKPLRGDARLDHGFAPIADSHR